MKSLFTLKRASEIQKEFLTLAKSFEKHWRVEQDPLAQGFFRLLAEIWAEFLEDLHQLPEKTWLDFLALSGLKPHALRAAEGLVVFKLNEKALEPVTIPPQTKVAAGDVLFETTSEFVATPASIKTLIGVWPAKDAFFDHSEALVQNKPFAPFSGLNQQEHVLYLGDRRFIYPEGHTALLLILETPQTPNELGKHLEWSYWDGKGWKPLTATYVPFYPHILSLFPELGLEPPALAEQSENENISHDLRSLSLDRPGAINVELIEEFGPFKGLFSLASTRMLAKLALPKDMSPCSARSLGVSQGESPLFWLRVKHVQYTDKLLPLKNVSFMSQGVLKVLPFQNGKALPSSGKRLFIFGQPSLPGSSFYLTFKDILVPGARVKLIFKSFSVYWGLKSNLSRVGDTSANFPLFWEFFDGKAWRLLDTKVEYVQNDLVISFVSPSGFIPGELHGQWGYWIRVNYQGPLPVGNQQISLFCEGIEALVEEPLGGGTAQQVLVENAGQVKRYKPGERPFISLPDPAAVYLGLDKPLEGGPYQIFFGVNKASSISPSRITWESWTEKGWEPLEVFDETSQFRHAGLWRIICPKGHLKADFFGKSRYWLRIKIDGVFSASEFQWHNIFFNAAWIRQGESFKEILDLKGLPGEEVRLFRHPIVDITVRVQGKGWKLVEDLEEWGPEDQVIEYDPAEGILRFGNGINGVIPPEGKGLLEVSYRVGGGPEGNVLKGAIKTLVSGIPAVTEVFNPVATTGGAPLEDTSTLIRRGAKRLRHRQRAITARDLEDLLEDMEEVSQALIIEPEILAEADLPEGIALDLPKEELVIYILPNSQEDQPWPRPQTIQKIRKGLYQRLPLTVTDFMITGPEYWETSVKAQIAVLPTISHLRVTQEAVKAIKSFLHPVSGGGKGKGWPFGRLPFRSDFLGLLHRLEGVVCVEMLQVFLRKPGENYLSLEDEGFMDEVFPPYAMVCPGPISVEIRRKNVSYTRFRS